jgi:nitrate/nitrite-specific signal transduction histidine kinase
MKITDVQNNLEVAIVQRKKEQADLENKLTMQIKDVSNKLDEVCEKLTDHIDRQDKFESRIENRMEDLGYLLRVFRWIGWAMTVAGGAAIIWFVNHFLNNK